MGSGVAAKKSSLLRRNFFQVARANAFAQALALGSAPILSRLYDPTDFGVFAIFTSVTGFAVAICTWRFDWSIPNARHTTTAAALMVLGLLVLSGMSALTTCAVIALYIFAPDWLEPIGGLAFLIPIFLVGAGILIIFEGWYVRANDLTLVSQARIAQSLTNTALATGGGVLALGPVGLIGAVVVAGWMGVVRLTVGASGFWSTLRRLTRAHVGATFRRFRGEAASSTLVSAVNAASFSAVLIVLSVYYTLHEVGWYTFMYRLAAAPIMLIASSLGQSFWGTSADLARRREYGELNTLYKRTTHRLALLILPILLGCGAGPFVVGPLFGEDRWGEAGYVLMAMAPMLIGYALFSPTNHLVVLGWQSLQLIADTVRLILCIGSILACGVWGYDIVAAVALSSVASLIGHALMYYVHLKMHAQLAQQ